MIKVMAFLKRRPGMSRQEFMHHWKDVHAPMGHGVPGVRRYLLHEPVEALGRADIPDLDLEFDGIAECWFDDLDAMKRSHASPEAQAWFADGALFIGLSRTLILDESVVIPNPARPV
ncbi:MAG: EthD domain-containing protein [Nevskiales bacterium]